MQMVKIQIPERSERARALVEMARRGRIICLPDDVFIVPEPALKLLQGLGVSFDLVESEYQPAEPRGKFGP